MSRVHWPLFLALAACSSGPLSKGSTDSPAQSSQDVAGDSDTDSDADSDTDSDADADTDTDADMEDTDSDAETGDTGSTQDCAMETPAPLWLSPDDSNSMASAQRARGLVLEGERGPLPTRIWEFLNYYSFDYEPAPHDGLLLNLQLAQDPDLPVGDYRLQIGVTSETRDRRTRQPLNLALTLDTSCSMSGAPLERMRDACFAISASLRDEDLVSAVTWDTSNNVLLDAHTVTGPSDPAVDAVCTGLASGGGTNLSGGLHEAYDRVLAAYDTERVNRVVLVSDGGANLGQTDAALIGERAGAQDEDGIYLVGIGVGSVRSYNDDLMDSVTDLGKGAALFLDSTAEADKMLTDRFIEVMDVAARNVEVRLDLPAGFEVVVFSGEELSTVRSEVEPQHLAPNDSMVFYQQIRTCDPTSVTDETPLTVAVTYTAPDTFEERTLEITSTFGALLAGETRQLRRGAALYAYAAALDSQGPADVDLAYARLAEADAEYPGDPELTEIRSVLDAL